MEYLEITELNTGKRHYRKIKSNCSITYSVEGRYIVIRNYYTGEKLQRHNIDNYGSIQFRIVEK